MRLRLVTYNIHKCVGGVDLRCDPARVADTLALCRPDVVLLQEAAHVHRGRTDGQADRIADHLGLRHRLYVPNVRVRTGAVYGNAILSRFPITDHANLDLTVPPKKARSALHARCRVRLPGATGGRTVHVYNLHLGLSGIERRLQLRRFLDSAAFLRLHRRTPVVVAGDFNDVWGTLGRQILAPAGFRVLPRSLRTFPAYAPLRALDSVYVRGDVRVISAHTARVGLARTASDHLPLVAELEVR
jgi:endonuclease/exonuclease/phosphatase family metal-dependent hydrolase